MEAKICGIKNVKTLKYILNHKYPPNFIGFIFNYPKSKRNLNLWELTKLLNLKKHHKINFVSVLVNPSDITLNKVLKFNFDYLQLYNVNPVRTKFIKEKYKIKIISAITVGSLKDVYAFNLYRRISEIILFDSKGYEKSLSFDHTLLENIPNDTKRMLAGNIKYNDNLEKFKKISDIIDLSGSLETQGEKDNKKINKFLKNIYRV
tara:strand:- start:19 stop:633 length:615 start_codon:yes stop_codon:yes gene_type:complete